MTTVHGSICSLCFCHRCHPIVGPSGQDQVWPDQVPDNQYSPCSAGDTFTQTRLMSAFRFNGPSCGASRLSPKAGVWVFGFWSSGFWVWATTHITQHNTTTPWFGQIWSWPTLVWRNLVLAKLAKLGFGQTWSGQNWSPGFFPDIWANVCGFLKPPDSHGLHKDMLASS